MSPGVTSASCTPWDEGAKGLLHPLHLTFISASQLVSEPALNSLEGFKGMRFCGLCARRQHKQELRRKILSVQVASKLPSPSSMTPFILGHLPFSLLCLRWDVSSEKGRWPVALHSTAWPHEDFAFGCWHLLANGASCWGSSCWGSSCWATTLVCGRLNLCDGEWRRGCLGKRR